MKFMHARHEHIWQILRHADLRLLAENNVFFAGGTCIALFYGEHRESEDIDFLCDPGHFGVFRNIVKERGLPAVFPGAQTEMRADRYGIRGRVEGVRLEIILEARIPVSGAVREEGLLTASPECLMAQKFLANSDRGMDVATLHKDIIDLAVLYKASPDSLERAFVMAYGAYKGSVPRDFSSALAHFARPEMRKAIAERLKIEPRALTDLLRGMVRIRKRLEMWTNEERVRYVIQECLDPRELERTMPYTDAGTLREVLRSAAGNPEAWGITEEAFTAWGKEHGLARRRQVPTPAGMRTDIVYDNF